MSAKGFEHSPVTSTKSLLLKLLTSCTPLFESVVGGSTEKIADYILTMSHSTPP